MAFGAVFFGFLAGFQTALGIGYLIHRRTEFNWIANLLFAFAFFIAAAKYGLMLMKTRAVTDEPSSQS